jgi:hypothetical protein
VKPLATVKHISRVTGLNRSQINKSFLPILNKVAAAAAAASAAAASVKEEQSENNEVIQREDGDDEIRISESG